MCLKVLGLPRLELRRLHTNLLFMFKITHSIVHTNLQRYKLPAWRDGYATRGHSYHQLYITRASKQV